MKKIMLNIYLLLIVVNFSYAAFPLKNNILNKNNIANPISDSGIIYLNNQIEENTNPTISYKNYEGYRHYSQPHEGSRALFWAFWGLFIWPFGILAIIHGIRGLNSRNGLERDKATLALIFGILEVLACILFVISIFYFQFLYIAPY